MKRIFLLCCLAIAPACASTTPSVEYLELAPDPQGINQAISACRAAPTPDCRDSMLVEGMAYYKFVFLDHLANLLGPHLVGVSSTFDLLDVGSEIALANVQGEREQRVLPIVGLVANGLQKIFWPVDTADRREAKAARMESDMLRLEAKIEERFGADLKRYPVAEALVDLRRFQDAATGVAVQLRPRVHRRLIGPLRFGRSVGFPEGRERMWEDTLRGSGTRNEVRTWVHPTSAARRLVGALDGTKAIWLGEFVWASCLEESVYSLAGSR